MESAITCAMAWLCPRDVASVALTCRSISRAACELTLRRRQDVAQGMEPCPVPVADNVGYPYFEYSPFCIQARSNDAKGFAWSGDGRGTPTTENADWCTFPDHGCDCVQCGSPSVLQPTNSVMGSGSQKRRAASCPCANAAPSKVLRWDNEQSCSLSAEEGLPSMHECGAACSCTRECIYRETQQGLSAKVVVSKSPNKGWGLYAAQTITRGSFICIYAGELLTTPESRKRQAAYDFARRQHCSDPKAKQTSALLVLREHLPSGQACLRVNIDATHVGNLARFINHSCDGGNLSPYFIRSTGSCFPRLAFFASRDIEVNQELTFSYGDTIEDPSRSQSCSCGTPACRGVLPSETT